MFFAYFALVGAYSPYLTLYYAAVGLTIAQIGVLVAVPQMVRLVGPSFWGWMADRVQHRLLLLRLASAASVLVTLGLALAGGNYALIFVLLALLAFATSAQTPLAETMALAAAGGDAGRYGRMRLWGSIGFTAAVALNGPLLDAVGVRLLPVVMCALAALLLAVTWRVPEPPRPAAKAVEPAWRRLREPAIAAFFGANFLMLFAHAALYSFYSLYLDGFGYSKSAIGLVWTVGVLSEIVMFRLQRRIFQRFDALALLGFSMLVAVLRFALMAWGGGDLVPVVVAQLLHAVTFGVHHSAVMAMLHRWFEPGQQARAQALYTTIGYGLGGSAGGLAASWMWLRIGPSNTYYAAALVAAVGCVVLAACRRFEYARLKGEGR